MSAILQNPETLKDAFESANEAQGSSLAENEKYLDSIQGRIDLFNNSLQTMWSNTIDSDFIKGIVDLGTELIKLIDKIGLIKSLLIALSSYAMIKHKMGPISFFKELINLVPKSIKSIQTWIQTAKAKDAAILKNIAIKRTDTATTSENTMANAANAASSTAAGEAEDKDTLDTIENIATTKIDTEVTEENTRANLANSGSNSGKITKGGKVVGTAKAAGAVGTKAIATKAAAGAAAGSAGAAAGSGAAASGAAASGAAASGSGAAAAGAGAAAGGIGVLGWAAIAVVVIAASIIAFNLLTESVEESKEAFQEARAEYEEMQSELDSLNSKLETTRDRIAELESMETLSFVDQEELNKLKQQNEELERSIELKEQMLETQKAVVADKAEKYIDASWDSGKWYDKAYAVDVNGVIVKDTAGTAGIDTKTALDKSMDEYQRVVEAQRSRNDIINGNSDINFDDGIDFEEYKKLYFAAIGSEYTGSEADFNKGYAGYSTLSTDEWMEYLKGTYLKEQMVKIAEGINMVLGDEEYANLEYGMSDEIDAFLDEFYSYQLKWAQAQGDNVKSSAISSMFGTSSNQYMQDLGKKLQDIVNDDSIEDKNQAILNVLDGLDGAEDGAVQLDNLSDSYSRLKNAMEITGVTAQDIADYFILETGAYNSSTIEGVTTQYLAALNVMKEIQNMQSDGTFIIDGANYDFDEFFDTDDEGKFEARADKFAEILKSMDENCRKTFVSLVTNVRNGELTWQQAIDSFSHYGSLAGLKVLEAHIIELNNVEFKNISDEISGVIDTFGELSAALDDVASSMDLLNKAQTQMNNSGRISVKTALEIMQTTDQWNDILKIENGNIELVGNATEILVENKLALIKANLQNALSTVTEQLAMIDSQEAGEGLATTMEESTNQAVRKLAGSMAYLTVMTEAYTRAANGATVDMDVVKKNAEAARQETESALNWKVNAANQTGGSNLEKRKSEIEAQLKMLEGIDTSSEFKNNYDFDKTPGDKYDDGNLDKFQKEMEYYENRISANQAKYEQIQNEIDLLEKQGKVAGEEYYQEQINLENERLELLEAQKAEAQKYLKTFKEGSDEYWEVAGQLNDIESSIDDVTASIQDLNDAMAEVDWYVFDETHKRFGSLIDDLNTIRDLISPNGEEDWFEDGMWTDKGVASLATHIQQLQMYQNALDDTNKKLEEYNKPYAGNEEYYKALGIDSEQELFDKREELINQQYDYKTAINDTQQSVVDMYEAQIGAVEEWADKAIDAYNDYIDVVKEALDAERDLHDFKKSIEEDTTNIAELERKIASLSGSTDAADIAQIRKLQAELNKAKSDLDDKYYDHAKDAQSDALDSEADAYEKSMKHFVSNLRTSLDTALLDMDKFMKGVTAAVINNAPAIKEQYNNLGLSLDEAIIDPWTEAADAMVDYETNGLGIMNGWITEGGAIYDFSINANDLLQTPWQDGETAVASFESSVDTAMKNVVADVKSNVADASAQLSSLYSQIVDTQKKVNNVTTTTTSGGGDTVKKIGASTGVSSTSGGNVKVVNGVSYTEVDGVYYKTKDVFESTLTGKKTYNVYKGSSAYSINGSKASAQFVKDTGVIGPRANKTYRTSDAVMLKDDVTGIYYVSWGGTGTGADRAYWIQGGTQQNAQKIKDALRSKNGWTPLSNYSGYGRRYAKGTLGTKKDEWAYTDEPWLGDELTMYATPQGTLSYMRAGSTVVPADLTKELMAIGEVGLDGLTSMPQFNSGINLMSNYVSKPELNLTFDSLVHVDHCDEGTLKNLEKMVDTKINDFSKQLNYSIKKFAR